MIKVNVTRSVEVKPFVVPESVDVTYGSGEGTKTLYISDVGQTTVDSLADDFLKQLYAAAGLRNPWNKANYR